MNIPRVGVGVIIYNDHKILLGKKINPAIWTAPGGKLEYKETIFDCAIRETKEECGINIKNLRFHSCSNCIDIYNHHYLTINIIAEYDSGNLIVGEEDKFLEWKWFLPEQIPEDLFSPTKEALALIRKQELFKEI